MNSFLKPDVPHVAQVSCCQRSRTGRSVGDTLRYPDGSALRGKAEYDHGPYHGAVGPLVEPSALDFEAIHLAACGVDRYSLDG